MFFFKAEDDDDIVFDVVEEAKASSLENRINQFSTKILLRGGDDAMQKGLLVEVTALFYELVEKLFEKYVKSLAKSADKAQIVLKTESMEHFISTPLRRVEDLTVDHLMVTIEKTQNSGVSIKLSDQLILEFLHIRLDKAWNLTGGVRGQNLLYFNCHYQKRSCRSMASVGSNMCLPASCIVGAAHESMLAARALSPADPELLDDRTKIYKHLTDNPGRNNTLKARVKDLLNKSGITFGTACSLAHLPLFEKILDVSFKVVSVPDQLRIVYKGPKHASREYIYLVYSKPSEASIGHYDLITNVRGFFGKPFYCKTCDVSYHNLYNHRCKDTIEYWCFGCYDPSCKQSQNAVDCAECGTKLNSAQCKKRHNGMRCGNRWKCKRCRKIIYERKVHDPAINGYRYQTNHEMEDDHDCDR